MANPVPRLIGDNAETRRFLDKIARDIDTLEGAATPAGAGEDFVTVAVNAALAASRHLAAGTGISLTDGGAGAALTIANTSPAKTFSIIGSSATTSGTTVTIGSLTSSPLLLVVFAGVSHDSASSNNIQIAVSDDGSNFDTAIAVGTATAAANTLFGFAIILRTAETAAKIIASGGPNQTFGGLQSSETGVTVSIRLSWSGGANFDAGNAYVIGFS